MSKTEDNNIKEVSSQSSSTVEKRESKEPVPPKFTDRMMLFSLNASMIKKNDSNKKK